MSEEQELTTDERVAFAAQLNRQGIAWPEAMRMALNYKPGGTGLAAYKQRVELERAAKRQRRSARERLQSDELGEGARRLQERGW